ncbi:MAG: hypothetical protein CME66_05970 [Halobacteriovoraceae bacterium]|nr:hypothetical protein [Halobacteriovoraceae bacterium]
MMSKFKTKIIKNIEALKPKLSQKIDKKMSNIAKLNKSQKADGSLVTEVDLLISNEIKQFVKKEFPEFSFYSEEDQECMKYPVCVLDPVDGTKELLRGSSEWVISFGMYFSNRLDDPRNFSWIYNPQTQFEISSESVSKAQTKSDQKILQGYVSRSEFESGLHVDTNTVCFKAVGSIAYKLALLAKGQCDFVLTKKAKNIWDIMAGTHICFLAGHEFYFQLQKCFIMEELAYDAPMIWTRSKNISKLKESIEK